LLLGHFAATNALQHASPALHPERNIDLRSCAPQRSSPSPFIPSEAGFKAKPKIMRSRGTLCWLFGLTRPELAEGTVGAAVRRSLIFLVGNTAHAWRASLLSAPTPTHVGTAGQACLSGVEGAVQRDGTKATTPQVNLSPGQNPLTRSVNTQKLHALAYPHANTRDLNSALMSHSPTPNCYA
jgi:hypothetical protein